jgi:hypothetical protein
MIWAEAETDHGATFHFALQMTGHDQADTLARLHKSIVSADILLLEGKLLAGTADAISALVRRAPKLRIIVQSVQNEEINRSNSIAEGFNESFRARSHQNCW